MSKSGSYPFTPSTSMGGCSTDRDIPASPLNSSSQPGSSEGSDVLGGSTSHNERFQLLPEGRHGPFLRCDHCHAIFIGESRLSSLNRHWREQHEYRDKIKCSEPDCKYTWDTGRESDFKKHLRSTKHKLGEDEIKERLARDRITCVLPPRSPPIERDSQSLVEPQQHLLSPPVMPLSLSEEAAQIMRELDEILLQSDQPEGSTAAGFPPNPGMLHIPLGGHHTSPFSGNPMVEPSGSTDPIYTPVADHCEIRTDTFAALDGCRVDGSWPALAGANWDLEP